jgi:hypothetical protein
MILSPFLSFPKFQAGKISGCATVFFDPLLAHPDNGGCSCSLLQTE